MRRISVIFALQAACACAYGQLFNVPFFGPDDDIFRQHLELMSRTEEQFRRMNIQRLPQSALAVRARCEPTTAVVGERCDLILELDIDRRVAFERLSPSGLPVGKDVPIEYDSWENMADLPSSTAGHVIKRMRLPMRFLSPFSREVPSLRIEGEVVDGARWPYAFERQFAPVRFEARPLPEEGRPANFSGAVGRQFEMKQMLDRDHVRPNDLITATYTLTFNGYCPSNICPNVEYPSKDFKVYKIKEEMRTNDRVVWKQDLVPLFFDLIDIFTCPRSGDQQIHFLFPECLYECFPGWFPDCFPEYFPG